MLINEKVYKRKSPEALALEATQAHYFLFMDKDLNYVLKHDEAQAAFELDLQLTVMQLAYNEQATKAMKNYVC